MPLKALSSLVLSVFSKFSTMSGYCFCNKKTKTKQQQLSTKTKVFLVWNFYLCSKKQETFLLPLTNKDNHQLQTEK